MSLTTIIYELLSGFWWIILIPIIIRLFQIPLIKGYLGEILVRFSARFLLDKDIYHRIDNITLPTPDGTTQIDHIIFSRYGIFVVETKNIRGWIFGSEDQKNWTQKIYRRTYQFQNPLRQNYKHIKTLEAVLQVPTHTIHSIIAFVGDAEFKTPMPPNVTRGTGFLAYIKSFKTVVFSDQELSNMLQTIRSRQLAPTFYTHYQHVLNLNERSNVPADRHCPKCGNLLVLRKSRTGVKAGQHFWGCSKFPKCRVTLDVS